MTKTTPFQIMLADDHVLLRNALGRFLETEDCFRVTDVLNDGQELIDKIKEGRIPDVVLLDLNMPRMDGFETCRWLSRHHPEVKILVLTMYDSEPALLRLLQDGVRGFLKKDVHPNELKHALVTVAEDGYYYTSSTSGKLAAQFRKTPTGRHGFEKNWLTEREIEFLKLAATDLTYKEIAIRMKVSTRVVDGFRDVLFEKLDVKSRVGLAIFALRSGIISI
jgi:DNA-binding NarL/FixJ family response regulator